MTTLENIQKDVRYSGTSYKIMIQSTFEDINGKHSLLWKIAPSMYSCVENPELIVTSFIHKIFDDSDSCKAESPCEKDGSKLIETKSIIDDETIEISKGVKNTLINNFGEETAINTLERDDIKINRDIPADLYEFEILVDGRFDENITQEEKLHHYYSWWLRPVENSPKLEIEKCFHKIWDKSTSSEIEEKYPGEVILDSRESPKQSPHMNSLPDDIIEELCINWGKPLIRNSIDSLPVYVYNCITCSLAIKSTPIRECPFCREDGLSKYKDKEHYVDASGKNEIVSIVD